MVYILNFMKLHLLHILNFIHDVLRRCQADDSHEMPRFIFYQLKKKKIRMLSTANFAWCFELKTWAQLFKTNNVVSLFVCVEVLRPSQPNGVMSSMVNLPNHKFTGQA